MFSFCCLAVLDCYRFESWVWGLGCQVHGKSYLASPIHDLGESVLPASKVESCRSHLRDREYVWAVTCSFRARPRLLARAWSWIGGHRQKGSMKTRWTSLIAAEIHLAMLQCAVVTPAHVRQQVWGWAPMKCSEGSCGFEEIPHGSKGIKPPEHLL